MSEFIAGSPADPILADDEALGLVRHHAPDAQTVQEVDESGHRARTYLVDDNLVLKTQRRSQIRPETSLAKEVLFLNHMLSDPRIQVPQVLGYGAEFWYRIHALEPNVRICGTPSTSRPFRTAAHPPRLWPDAAPDPPASPSAARREPRVPRPLRC